MILKHTWRQTFDSLKRKRLSEIEILKIAVQLFAKNEQYQNVYTKRIQYTVYVLQYDHFASSKAYFMISCIPYFDQNLINLVRTTRYTFTRKTKLWN